MNHLKNYYFPLLLIVCLFLGGLWGFIYPHEAKIIQPLGNLFLNLIFTSIVPLVFFSVSSAIAKMNSIKTLQKLFVTMFSVFFLMGGIAAIMSIGVVKLFPLNNSYHLNLDTITSVHKVFSMELLTNIFSVDDFSQLLNHQHMLALIVFAILTGRASHFNQSFKVFLQAGEEVFMRIFSYIMYLAPIGFFAYFSNLVAELGAKFLNDYFKISVLYYSFAIAYFIFIFSSWMVLFCKKQGLFAFWKNISIPALTALATCSSAASIPANIQACKNLHITPMIFETTIPLGSLLHKQGSIIGGIFKIAFLFSLYHMPFDGLITPSLAMIVALLVGTVMGAIPSGGMLGELLILHVYGFPNSALVAIAAFSVIIDPIATMLNVCGNTVSTSIISKLIKTHE